MRLARRALAGRLTPGRGAAPLGAVVLVAVLVLTAGCATSGPRPVSGGNAIITHVIDGDTVDVAVAGRDERVRLLGIDSPETVDPQRPPECFGAEASAHLRDLLPDGTSVTLVRDLEPRDRFGRLLAYVYRADDGTFVNHAMVAGGFADVLIIAPNDALAGELRAARRAAQAADAGMWGACRGPDEAPS